MSNLRTALFDLSAQEVFDLVAVRLLAQGRSSYDTSDYGHACVYTNTDGLHCAVGLLMDKTELDIVEDTRSNKAALPLLIDRAREYFCVDGRQLDTTSDSSYSVIRALQDVHDTASNSTDWIGYITARLRYVAKEHNLSAKVVTGE